MFESKEQKFFFILLIILSICVYLNSIFGEFVLDDEMLIQKNPAIQSLLGVHRFNYRWVRTFSYAIDYSLWGLNPIGYHLSNIFYNTLTVIVVFLLTKRLTGIYLVSFITALTFAVHPIHTEAVSYLSGRRDILSALFYFLGFYLYLKVREKKRWWSYAVVLLCYLAAISSKEMAITLPLLIFVYEVLETVRHNHQREASRFSILIYSFWANLKRLKAPIVGILILVTGYLYVVLFVQHASRRLSPDEISWWGGSLVSNFATISTVLLAYVQKTFFPTILRFDYHQFPYAASFLDPGVLISILLIFLLLLISIMMIKRNPLLTFCVWWFFITLLPVMQIIPHHILMAEHYLYLPSYGFCLAVGLIFHSIYETKTARVSAVAVMIVILLCFFSRTLVRNMDWQDHFTLMKHGLRHDPENPLMHFFYGLEYLKKNLLQSANKELQRAEGPRYRNANIFAYRALLSFRQGDYDKGVQESMRALQYDPAHDMSLFNRAFFAMKMGDNETALEYFEKVNPNFRENEPLIYMALIYKSLGNFEKAESILLNLSGRQSDRMVVHALLGDIYMKTAKFEKSLKEYEIAQTLRRSSSRNEHIQGVNLSPESISKNIKIIHGLEKRYKKAINLLSKKYLWEGHRLLGEVYFTAQNYEFAEKEFLLALPHAEDENEIHLFLGKTYYFLNRIAEAEIFFSRIISSENNDINHLIDAGQYYVRNLQLEQAEKLYRRILEEKPGHQAAVQALEEVKRLKVFVQRANLLESSGNESKAALLRGDLYNAVGEKERAKEFWVSLLDKDPDDIDALKRITLLYETMGFPYLSKTIKAYRDLLSLDANNAGAYRKLGELYYTVIEDYESALECFQKSLALDPHQKGADRVKNATNILRQYVKQYLAEDT